MIVPRLLILQPHPTFFRSGVPDSVRRLSVVSALDSRRRLPWSPLFVVRGDLRIEGSRRWPPHRFCSITAPP
ncbi:MAG: hypothetical protein MI924_38405, partial [Chloroflexales bacterium]|nr:hypothetical protein [Chloroflexales bacterium]